MYVRKEAVLSSMIEGTQSSLSDLLLYELDQEPGVPLDDVLEVSNYVSALNHGLDRMSEGFPFSLRLIKEIHAKLLSSGRGDTKTPGRFRRSQNWIGGTRPGNAFYVPPPANDVKSCMGDLELFLHNKPKPTPTLLKAALAHVQFETIHPFLDGNGRLCRLLITLILCHENILRDPTLYLSLFFKNHRQQYYDLLNNVRLKGDWESWLDFFAEAVISTASQAVETAQQLHEITSFHREQISSLGRASSSVLSVHQSLIERPITNAKWLRKQTGLTSATINRALLKLEHLNIVRNIGDKRRNRVFSYDQHIDILNRGTEALAE